MPLVLALGAGVAAAAGDDEPPRWEPRPGDRIVLLGSALAERTQHDGWLEARLALAAPDLGLTLRNGAVAGDELLRWHRTAGTPGWQEWLALCEADVVFAFYGTVESFAGPAGLPDFRARLVAFLDELAALRIGGSAPRVVLFSPIPCEDLGDPLLPDAEAAAARLAPYVAAMAAVATERGVPFVDLFAPMAERLARDDELTFDGCHLTERGHRELADVVVQALLGGGAPAEAAGAGAAGAADPGAISSRRTAEAAAPDAALLERVQAAVIEKDRAWFQRYRATDDNNVHGGRSSLAYVDGVTNFEVLQRELEVLDALTALLDERVHAAARGEVLPEQPSVLDGWLPGGGTVPPLIEVETNRPGAGPDGAHLYLGGDEALGRMTTAAGLEVSLFADEAAFPQLANPVQMAFDPAGRLWVATWPTYPHWRPGQPMDDALLVLEDADGDGRADRCTAFADDLHNPTGFEHWNGGVLVACAPDLLFLRDVDGDGRADQRERVLGALSSADTHHAANSFVLGPDGALYFQEGIFHRTQLETPWGVVRNDDACVWRWSPRSFRAERHVAYGLLNPHGHVFDRWGQELVTDGTGNANYYALPVSGHVEYPGRHAGYFTFFQQRSRPAAATEILSSRHFPDAMQGRYLIANVIGFQGIFQYELVDDGSGFAAVEHEPLLQSSDPNFRPVDLEVGPDGALWLLDWHAPLIGHMQHHLRDPSRDHVHGRVYRVTASGRPLTAPAPIAGQPLAALLEHLRDPDDRVRYRTRLELSGRPSAEVVAAARAWAAGLDDEHDLLEALWLQQQHGVLDEELLLRLLGASDPRARAAATRVLRQMRDRVADPLVPLAHAVADEHPRVRLEAVVALSSVPQAEAAELALRVLSRPMDRFLDYALGETLATLAPHWQAALAGGAPFAAGDPPGLAHALALLPTSLLSGVRPGEALFREVLGRAGAPREQVEQALAGLAALQGSTPAAELLAALERADARTDGHADHLLSGLFDVLAGMPAGAQAALAEPLRALAAGGRRASTRRLATVARLRADGSVGPAWASAAGSPAALAALLDAAALLDDPRLAEELFPRVLALLEKPAGAAPATLARFVRVELPGGARTLTLAEVEVLSGGSNVAPGGSATQSSTNWEGVAARAIDGNTSGTYADGGQTHTMEDLPDPWWELDLGRELPVERVVLWNRTDAGGQFVTRLDGALLRLLDGERRVVFEHTGGRAAARLEVEVASPALTLRRAAVRCLAALGVRPDETVTALIGCCDDEALRATAVAGLAAIPVERWPAGAATTLAERLLATFEEAAALPDDAFATDDGRRLLSLADALAPHLADDLATRLRAARRRLGPQVLVVRPVPDALLFDRTELVVVAGRPVELLFENVDIMPHNLVVTAPGALARVGLAAEAMAAAPDAWERAFVPDLPEVLAATGLLQPGESETLVFDAPETPGEHPFVCTFPGHWVRMNGTLHVVASWEEALGAAPGPTAAAAAPGRAFVRRWTAADLLPHLDAVEAGDAATLERGRAVFDAASCHLCHAVGDTGGRTGPELSAVVGRYDRAGLLAQVLQPSAVLAEGYAAELVFTTDGKVHAGRVLAEDAETLHLQADPYRDETLAIPKASIESRRTSEVSLMPDGLLTTFERDEILALLAYLESLAPRPTDG